MLYTKTRLLTRAYIIMAHMQNIRPVTGRKGKLEDDHIQNVSKENLQYHFSAATGFVKEKQLNSL